MKSSAAVFGLVPPGVVTVTSTTPALCGGATATTVVESTNECRATTPSNRTVMPLAVKFVPVIVTMVLPIASPVAGSSDVIVGPPV